MTRIARFSAAALVAAGTLGAPAAQARGGGGALAAGILGGLAAGALIGAAAQAHAAPVYADPAYGYAPPRPAYRAYEVDGPVYETRRVVTYERVPVARVPVGYDRPWRGGWDGGYGYRGW